MHSVETIAYLTSHTYLEFEQAQPVFPLCLCVLCEWWSILFGDWKEYINKLGSGGLQFCFWCYIKTETVKWRRWRQRLRFMQLFEWRMEMKDWKGIEWERENERDRRKKSATVNKIENAVVVPVGAVVGRMFSHNNEFYFCSIAIAQCLIRLTELE